MSIRSANPEEAGTDVLNVLKVLAIYGRLSQSVSGC
jgi:hypothetical protein